MITQRATVYPAGVLLSAPYDPIATPALVEALKRLVPQTSRRYLHDSREWFIASAYVDQVIALFRNCFPNAEVIHTDGPPPPPAQPRPLAGEQEYAVLHLLPSAPCELIEAAYRVLAKAHHPDRHPAARRDQAHRTMLAINAAYEALHAHVPTPMERNP